MDEAVLTIRFKDESSPGPAGVATVAPQYGGSDQGGKSSDVRDAITQAGKQSQPSDGVRPAAPAPVPAAAAMPVPAASPQSVTAVGDPLLKTAQGIIAADPNVTIAELAKALQISNSRAQQLLQGGAGLPPVQQQPAASPAQALPVPPTGALPPSPAAAPHPPSPPPPPAGTVPPPPPPTPPPIAGTPPTPPPIVNPPPGQPGPSPAGHGVQQAIGAIASFASRGGPLGAAAGRAATAVAAIPGVPSTLAATVPALASVGGPLVLAGTVASAVPRAAAAAIDSIAQTARGQIQGLSPEVAAAEADANIRQLVANMRTADRLGDEVANYVTARSRISAASQGLRDVASEPILREFADATEGVAMLIEGLNDFAQRNPAIVQTGAQAGAGAVMGSTGAVGMVAYKLLAWLGRQEQNDAVADNPLTRFNMLPMPTLPPPFREAGFLPTPVEREFSSLPGLSF